MLSFRIGRVDYPLEVTDVRLGNVLYNTRKNRTVLFKNQQVDVCFFGTMRNKTSVPVSMQNSVHGIIGIITNVFDFKHSFCDLKTDACFDTRPACGEPFVEDNNFCLCSTLQVPGITPTVRHY